MKNRDVIVHVHIFKNAGSSFDGALLENFGDNFIDHRDDHLIRNDKNFLNNYLRDNPNIKAFSSHSAYFKPKSFKNVNIHPIYMLRHPIERIKSVYSFEKKQPATDSLGAKMAKELDLPEYVEWRMREDVPATIRNLQTIFLAGDDFHPRRLPEKYKMALETLESEPLIGVVDRYDESMVVFEEYLRDYFPKIDLSYVRKNVTDANIETSVEEKTQKLLSQLDAVTQTLVKEKNEFDLELYALANKKLDSKIANIKDFDSMLSEFKGRCALKLVRAMVDGQDYQSAIALAETIMQSGSKNIHLYLATADAYAKIKDYNKALNTYEECIRIFSNNPWAYFFRAEMYALLGENKKAKEIFESCKIRFEKESKVIDIFSNKDFIRTYSLGNTKRKKIFIQANCQSHALRHIFQKTDRLNKKYKIIDAKPVHLWMDVDKDDIFGKVMECDILIHQPIYELHFGQFSSDNLKKYLKDDAISICFPNLYFTGYHPQVFDLKDMNGKKVSEPFDYHDKNIVNFFKQGMEIEKAILAIEDDCFYTRKEIEDNIEQSLESLKEREEKADIVISDYIEKNMMGKKLFHVFNHPSNEVLFELLDRILKYLNESRMTDAEKVLFKTEFLGQVQYPIYLSVEKYFNTNSKNTLLSFGKECSYREAIYLYYDRYKYLFDTKPNAVNINFKEANDKKNKIIDISLEKSLEHNYSINDIHAVKNNDFIIDQYYGPISDYMVEELNDKRIVTFKKPLNAKDYYQFAKTKFKVPNIKTYKLSEAYLTIDFSKNYQYKFYIFNDKKEYMKDFSIGEEPFFSENTLVIVDENVAFIEDKFTKFNIAHLYIDKMTRIPIFENFDIGSYILSSSNKYIMDLFNIMNKKFLAPDINNDNFSSVTYKIKNLYLNSCSFSDHIHPLQEMIKRNTDYLKFISSRFDSNSNTDLSTKRIFIDRSMAQTRKIDNILEVKEVLEKYNISLVRLENLSLKEQVNTFKAADLVIGTHGAGLTNILFSKRDTTIIEILAPLCASTSFWKLSESMNMRYDCIVALDPTGIIPNYKKWEHNPAKYNNRNIIVPVDELESKIKNYLSFVRDKV